MNKTALGFTLVELLVVITIMAVVGVYTLSNYRTFGEDQGLRNGVLDVQSQLRTGQISATTNVICDSNQSAATWEVAYQINGTDANLNCQRPASSSFLKKSWKLGTNIKISGVSGSGICPSALPFSIKFTPLFGKTSFFDSTGTEMTSCTMLTITLQNTKTNNTKALNIDQGGRIYAQ